MIRYLNGEIIECHSTNIVVLMGGIGVRVFTPPLSVQPGDHITLHTHLAVRETALDLYGFPSTLALELFELLLTVPKIGPKSAMQIMSAVDPAQLVAAIAQENQSLIASLPGLRGKTGTTVLGHLKGKVNHLHTNEVAVNPLLEEAIAVLQSFGYSYEAARERVQPYAQETDLTTIIKQALAHR